MYDLTSGIVSFITNIFFNNFFENVFFYIGVVLAAYAVYGFITFLNGFLSGAPHVFLHDGHIEHQDHAETRVIQGMFMLWTAFCIWEVLRVPASWLGVGTANTTLALIILGISAFAWIMGKLTGKKGGGGH